MPTIKSNETLDIKGTLDATSGTVTVRDDTFSRAKLIQETGAVYGVPISDMRVWDNLASLLPGTAAADDLAVIEGTFGTDSPTIQSSDGKATTITQYARFTFTLPPEYIETSTVTLNLRAGMITTVSDTTATIDAQVYAHDGDGGVGSDLCATSAQTINNLTKASKSFAITSTSLSPGDVLDVRLTVAITDGATGTAVIGEISEASLSLNIRG